MTINTFSKYLGMGALALGLWSCSNEEPAVPEIPTFDTDKVAMTINVYGSSGMSRADGASTDYADGSDDENEVKSLNFYFYDRAGEYVTSYLNATYTPGSSDNFLVEEIGTAKIVLTGLLGTNYPSYVVAVLNVGVPGTTTGSNVLDLRNKSLNQAFEQIRNAEPWTSTTTNGVTKETEFIMTSATHSNNSSEFHYFATPINADNFILMDGEQQGQDFPENAQGNPVDIYVERLASKVELKLSNKFTKNEDGVYELNLTQNGTSDIVIDGEKKSLKLQILGWGLNGVAKKMLYFKSVNENPAFTTADGWNYDGTNRCYWARTPGYGTNQYSSSFGDVKDKSGASGTQDYEAINEPLKYISWNTVKTNGFKRDSYYVMPHTEAGEQINLQGNQIHHSALTEVLIAAQIVDETGKGMTLFQLSDSYYTREGVINYLLNAAGTHIWKKVTPDAGEEFKSSSIEASDVDIKYGYDGTFSIVVKTVTDWYKDQDCTEKWLSNEVVAAEINAYLPDQQSYCYNDGMMYYNVPIQHLRKYTKGEEIKTGMFGVVRNHWYQVTISDIKNLGHSVYRPEEHIIPPSDDTRYMIGSSIKILSWRLVKQNVEL